MTLRVHLVVALSVVSCGSSETRSPQGACVVGVWHSGEQTCFALCPAHSECAQPDCREATLSAFMVDGSYLVTGVTYSASQGTMTAAAVPEKQRWAIGDGGVLAFGRATATNWRCGVSTLDLDLNTLTRATAPIERAVARAIDGGAWSRVPVD